jgi:uncharacterized protein YukE
VSWYGDPDRLERLARELEEQAEGIDERRRALRSRAAAVRWEGAGGSAFRVAVGEDATALHESADRLRDAAAELRRHAAEVREQLALIRAIETAARAWFVDQAQALARVAAELLADPVAAVRAVVSTPPWERWPWRPDSLPLPGSRDWLEVGDFLRRQGVVL